jgi:ubiquinone/menaquinone biosynthesis C-methylase UbiE
MPSRAHVRLAKRAMRLAEVHPNPDDPTLRERFNRREFTEAPRQERLQMMLELSDSHYRHELELPLHIWLGIEQERLKELLRGKTVLDLGCFVAGTSLAYAEAYAIGHIYGLDIDEKLLDAARQFAQGRSARFDFICGYGEENPLSDEQVDAIITQDTLEHVVDVDATLGECFRVLKPSGLVFCVFPSFYHPFGNHLNLVTNMPWLHLFFSDAVLETAYRELVEERGSAASWYSPGHELEVRRQRFYSVNGVTLRSFRRAAQAAGFTIVHRNVVPLLRLGRRLTRHPSLRALSRPLGALAALPVLEEALSHRACYVLQKPPLDWSAPPIASSASDT